MLTDSQNTTTIRFFVLLIPVAYISYLFHELGHWTVGEVLGNRMVFSLNYVWPKDGHYIREGQDFYVLLGGPSFSMLEAIIALLIIERTKARYVYPFAFFPMFNRIFLLLFGGFSRQDEAKIALVMNTGSCAVATIVVAILLSFVRLSKLVCCVLLISFSACGHPPASDGSPEAEIVRQLSQRRVVMLGDFAHDCPLPLQRLISTLTTWLDMVQRGESKQYHLTLFLEEDRRVAHLIKGYLEDGNLTPLLDYILPSTTIERLEFYADLRAITTRVALMNSRRSPSEQISFDVEGPEAMSLFDTVALTWSAREGRLYFVRDRDSLTASNVTSYLSEHPKARALMFFGNGHLIGNMVQKDFSGVLTTEESKGVWLGHYLKKAFGADQVFTISSVGRTRSRLRLDEFAGKDAFLLSPQVPWKDSPPEENDLVPDNFDAFVIWDGFIIPGHPLQYVRSQRIADAAIRRLEFLAPYRSGALGNRFFREAQTTLSFLCDTSFSEVEEWKTWLREHPIEGLAQLQSPEFQERLFERSSEVLGTDDFMRTIDQLIDLGYDSRVGTPAMSKAEWGAHLTAQWPQIVCLNAIGIFWTGYSNEETIARQYLAEAGSGALKDPSESLKWWRREFYGVTY